MPEDALIHYKRISAWCETGCLEYFRLLLIVGFNASTLQTKPPTDRKTCIMTPTPPIAPHDHKTYMRYALEQAKLSPPSPSKFCVGAALVDADANRVLSTGYSEELARDRPNDPGSTHAEHCCFIKVADENGIHDFDIAPVLPPNTVLYTTMEPCNERLSGNRTCVERILGLGSAIKVVYVGIREPNTFIQDNQGIKRLEAAGVKVVLLEDDETLRQEILEVTFAGHEKRG
ncbi:hypothetical protein QC762_507630 [Podospora pseudocomata]|uniref:CMP/dCMP-type deaminase domain-containing protein n=1 Tax=Podospora pseudocomata TaxID=2093779 RepID=A0ABR0GD00_9PEZI|nr:hypothetical protein QC762_507630 [Podospora pseudocomata]